MNTDAMTASAVTIGVTAIFGLVIGSFLTVVVARVPDGRSIVQPRSACDQCDHRLGAADLVPVVSWVRSRGHCRYCNADIGTDVLWVELGTGFVFAMMGWRFGPHPILIPYLVLGGALVALSAIDIRTYRLPREISYTAFMISVAAMAVIALFDGDWNPLRRGLFGAAGAFATLLLVYIASRGEMGSGDVRLSPLLGLHLGYLGLAMVPIGLFAGFVLGAVIGLVGLVSGKAGLKTGIPFGPFLAAGTLVGVWWGEPIADWLRPWVVS